MSYLLDKILKDEFTGFSFFCNDFIFRTYDSERHYQNKTCSSSIKKFGGTGLKESKKSIKDVEIEIDGLMVDETKTKSGKDFYDYFYSNWQPPEKARNFSITISEKPFQLISTLISVTVNENTVYQAILQPRQDIIEALAGEAISYAQDFLSNYQDYMKELNGDDMTGSGIF